MTLLLHSDQQHQLHCTPQAQFFFFKKSANIHVGNKLCSVDKCKRFEHRPCDKKHISVTLNMDIVID
jgi:hypothetical protein